MRATPSTEFNDWIYFFEHEEWHERTKLEYYLARILAELRRSWIAKPEEIDDKDFLCDFTTTQEEYEVVRKKRQGPRKEYKIGPELVQDPKWALVNAKAKAVWAQRFGLTDITHAGNTCPGTGNPARQDRSRR